MPGTCKVCNESISKYKCPTCLINYCSVTCYKQHKENCMKQGLPGSNNEPLQTVNGESVKKSYEFETEHTVPLGKLQLLRYNSEILSCLKNPHLREMLKHLNSCSRPTMEMTNAMKEPIFYEFASECLKAVEGDAHLYAKDSTDSEGCF